VAKKPKAKFIGWCGSRHPDFAKGGHFGVFQILDGTSRFKVVLVGKDRK
jgi:hypothetical protein